MRLATVTLSQLRYNPLINARGSTETEIGELKATIKAKGLGQPLLLRQAADGLFEPVEGGRRYRALTELAAEGALPPDHPIPALIRELSDAEALELSLATAVTRLPLNAADEAVSFATLVEAGTDATEIAAHFGVPVRRVWQRLAIANLPKKIVAALRQGRIGVEIAEAFTLGTDAKQVGKLFDDVMKSGDLDNARFIRSQLVQKRVPLGAREGKFVGVDAYQAAGGVIDEDLFSLDRWFADGKLLNKLFDAKLKSEEKRLADEGWSFVIVDTETYSSKYFGWPGLKPEAQPNLTKEQKARRIELATEIKKLRKALDGDDEDGQISDALTAAEEEHDALIAGTFTEAQKKKAGVVINFSGDEVKIRLGVMRPAAAKKEQATKKSKQTKNLSSPGLSRGPIDEPEADFSQANTVEMASAMTQAMQAKIAETPALAARALCAALLHLSDGTNASPFEIEPGHITGGPLQKALATARKPFSDKQGLLELGDVFARLESSDATTLASLQALALGALFSCGGAIDEELRPLIDAFDPHITLWQPGEEFFRRLPKEALAQALGEAAIAGVTPSKKKAELVAMCLKSLVPLAWLPKPLRAPSYKGPGSNTWSDAHAANLADQIAAE
jgi:ParB family chromosome partitioning protein